MLCLWMSCSERRFAEKGPSGECVLPRQPPPLIREPILSSTLTRALEQSRPYDGDRRTGVAVLPHELHPSPYRHPCRTQHRRPPTKALCTRARYNQDLRFECAAEAAAYGDNAISLSQYVVTARSFYTHRLRSARAQHTNSYA